MILIACAALLAALAPTASQRAASAAVPGAGTPDQFVYDEAGRLRAVIDVEGDVAKYRYDNLSSGTLRADSVPPIRLVEHEGSMFSLDNRRLVAFQEDDV